MPAFRLPRLCVSMFNSADWTSLVQVVRYQMAQRWRTSWKTKANEMEYCSHRYDWEIAICQQPDLIGVDLGRESRPRNGYLRAQPTFLQPHLLFTCSLGCHAHSLLLLRERFRVADTGVIRYWMAWNSSIRQSARSWSLCSLLSY